MIIQKNYAIWKRFKSVFKDIGKCSIGKARNYAIQLIESDFLIFLDSDDALTDDRLSCDYKVLNQHQNLNFIYGDSIQINKKSFKKSYYCKSSKFADKYQLLNIPYNLSSLTVSRKFLQRVIFYLEQVKRAV